MIKYVMVIVLFTLVFPLQLYSLPVPSFVDKDDGLEEEYIGNGGNDRLGALTAGIDIGIVIMGSLSYMMLTDDNDPNDSLGYVIGLGGIIVLISAIAYTI